MKYLSGICFLLSLLIICLSLCACGAAEDITEQPSTEATDTPKTENATEKATQRPPRQQSADAQNNNQDNSYEAKLAKAVSEFDPSVFSNLKLIPAVDMDTASMELIAVICKETEPKRELTLSLKDRIVSINTKDVNQDYSSERYLYIGNNEITHFYKDEDGEWTADDLFDAYVTDLFGENADISAIKDASVPEMSANDLTKYFANYTVSHDYIVKFMRENYSLLFTDRVFDESELRNTLSDRAVRVCVNASQDGKLNSVMLYVRTVPKSVDPSCESYASIQIKIAANRTDIEEIAFMRGKDLSAQTGKTVFHSDSLTISNTFDNNGEYLHSSAIINYTKVESLDKIDTSEPESDIKSYEHTVLITSRGMIMSMGAGKEDGNFLSLEITSNADEAYRVSVTENTATGEKTVSGKSIAPTGDQLWERSLWIDLDAKKDQNSIYSVSGRWSQYSIDTDTIIGEIMLNEAPRFPAELPEIVTEHIK